MVTSLELQPLTQRSISPEAPAPLDDYATASWALQEASVSVTHGQPILDHEGATFSLSTLTANEATVVRATLTRGDSIPSYAWYVFVTHNGMTKPFEVRLKKEVLDQTKTRDGSYQLEGKRPLDQATLEQPVMYFTNLIDRTPMFPQYADTRAIQVMFSGNQSDKRSS